MFLPLTDSNKLVSVSLIVSSVNKVQEPLPAREMLPERAGKWWLMLKSEAKGHTLFTKHGDLLEDPENC